MDSCKALLEGDLHAVLHDFSILCQGVRMNRKSIRIVGVLSKITLAEDQPQTTTTTKLKETATSKSTPRKRAAKRNQK